MSLPLVLYHANCWDGFCAAWVARMALGTIEAKPVQYGHPPPVIDGREVYILDFSFPRPLLLEMKQRTTSLLVLDHHATAVQVLEGLEFCRFDLGKSGGRLAWEWFAPIGGWVGIAAPWLVDYTEDRDLWRHQLPESQAINAALRSYPLDFALWDEFNRCSPDTFIREGIAIRRSEQQIIDTHVKNAAEQVIDGHRVLVVNATVLVSEIAGALAKDRPFGACYFDRADGKRQWSLRSAPSGIDVAELATHHGGGGHPHAAGFETTP